MESLGHRKEKLHEPLLYNDDGDGDDDEGPDDLCARKSPRTLRQLIPPLTPTAVATTTKGATTKRRIVMGAEHMRVAMRSQPRQQPRRDRHQQPARVIRGGTLRGKWV